MSLGSKKKAELSVQAIFYIMMSVVFVSILVFGYQKITDVSDVISEQERIEIGTKIKEAFEYCNDPLNRGNSRVIELRSPEYNGVCLGDGGSQLKESELKDEIKQINEAGDNVVLIKTIISNQKEILEYNVIDSFYAEVKENMCWLDYENQDTINIEIKC